MINRQSARLSPDRLQLEHHHRDSRIPIRLSSQLSSDRLQHHRDPRVFRNRQHRNSRSVTSRLHPTATNQFPIILKLYLIRILRLQFRYQPRDTRASKNRKQLNPNYRI